MSTHGPNVTKLIIQFSACLAVPNGSGVAGAVEFFRNVDLRKGILSNAEKMALESIHLIKTAPDNPYGDNDEAIAGAILEKIADKQKSQRKG